jgi:DNA invertase Pin-like site-specific DNA recombinase
MVAQAVPAVAYYRMRTDRQEASIRRQRESVEAYASANGYQILREYSDEGISGDATEKRAGFLKMRDDAGRGDFQVILCWDKDRFGRFDSIEQGYWVKPLRDAGVRLVTVTQGAIDWNSFGGRIVDAALAESKHEFLRTLGQNTAAGHVRNAQLAYFNGGSVPYGFDRMLLNERDEPVRRLRRGERTDKPRGWHTILVPVEDPREIETACWLFRSFAEREVSYRTLANELNARGVPGPGSAERGRPTTWGRQTVMDLLRNPHYVGVSAYGRVSRGKFCRVLGGEARPVSSVAKTKSGTPKKQVNTGGLIVNPEAHAGVIDRELWDRVQEKIKARRRDKQYPRGTGYPLAGLVHCGHCGKRMHGCTFRFNKRKGRQAYRRYVCSSNNLNGKSSCGFHAVREDLLLPFLVRKLQEDYLAPDRLQRLKAELREQVAAARKAPPVDTERLRKRLAQLDADISRGVQNLLRAGDNFDLLNANLTELRAERARLARNLESQERALGVKPAEAERLVASAVEALRRLGELLNRAEPGQLREVMRQLVAGIDLYFEAVPKRQRVFHTLVKGVVRLRPQAAGPVIGECQAWDRNTSSIRRMPRCQRKGAICRRVTSGPLRAPASYKRVRPSASMTVQPPCPTARNVHRKSSAGWRAAPAAKPTQSQASAARAAQRQRPRSVGRVKTAKRPM